MDLSEIIKLFMQRLVLVSARICPFAERAHITLEQKGIQYDLNQVDLKNKSEEFTTLYRKGLGCDPDSDGKVPVLVDGEIILTESDLIAWYLAQKFDSGSQLIPTDPLMRFKVRQFAKNFSKIITNFYSFKGWVDKSQEQRQRLLSRSAKDLKELNDQLALPYALGDQFTLADVLIYPWLIRWPAIETHIGMPRNHELVKIGEWVQNIQKRESIKKNMRPTQFFIDGYAGYFI